MRLALLVLLVGCSGSAPQPRPLFSPVGARTLESTAPAPIDLDLAAIDAGEFRLDVGNDKLVARKLAKKPVGNGVVVRGLLDKKKGRIVLARVGNRVSGVIRLGDRGYEIVPTAAGHRLVPRSWKKIRLRHGPKWADVSANRGQRPPPKPASQAIEISVLFAYTKSVLEQRTADGVRSFVEVVLDDLNAACTAAKLDVRFTAAGLKETSDTEAGNDLDEIYFALLDKTHFVDAHAERKAKRADILVLLIDQAQGGLGLATIMGTPDTAVAVADHHDSIWYLTVPHEIGHIMGGLHDDDSRTDPFPYGHGFLGANRTIMSNSCLRPWECPLLERWSAPPDLGTPEHNDNARVIRETASTVATFGEQL